MREDGRRGPGGFRLATPGAGPRGRSAPVPGDYRPRAVRLTRAHFPQVMLRSARVVARTARPRCLSGGAPTKHGVSQELRPVHQDMPPPGGYPSVLFAKAQKDRGPEGWKIWAAAMAVVAVGFYRVGQTNLERNAAKREKREARMSMVPYLQAEEDRRFCASEDAEDAEEARVMEGVKGWTVGESVYSSGVWEPPSRTDHPRPTF